MDRRVGFMGVTAGLMAALLLIPAVGSTERKPRDWNPTINPADFVVGVDNQYFPLPQGRILRYQGSTREGTETMEFEVTSQTKVIMGVTTMVVIERHSLNGQLEEVSENWFAQDRNGDVWYFGELSQSYENGVPSGTEGSWEAGVADALPGIIMKADPQIGDAYFQEFAPGVAEDQAEVTGTNGSATVLQGSFGGVLETREWTRLEPGGPERKYYAPGVGLILERKGNERLELQQIVG